MKSVRSILFVTYHFPPEVGGIQTRISHYLVELARRGIGSTVIVFRPEVAAPSMLDQGSPVRIVRADGTLTHLPSNLLGLLNHLSRGRADVVHVFTGASTLFGMLTLMSGRLFRMPAAMSLFGREDVALESRVSRVIFLLSASVATSISTNSEATRGLLPARFRGKSHVLLGGSDPAPSPSSGSPRDSSVLFVGRLVKRKGVDDLLRAFDKVAARIPQARLTVVGDGPERENLKRMAADFGISDKVHFTGSLRSEALHAEYEKCDVFVLPSKTVEGDPASEGLGLALIEAAMHGKPLVGTLHGGMPEIIRNGVNGILVPECDPASLESAILSILLDAGLARRLGASAVEIAHARFSWESATSRLLETYVN